MKKFSPLFVLAILALFYSVSAKASDAEPPKPTVEDCVERMGFTEEKCVEMMENMKNMKPGDMKPGEGREMKRGGQEGLPPGDKSKTDNLVEKELEMAKRMKTMEENRFSRTETRIEKIIEFLNSKDIDTGTIENDLETFKDKISVISNALDNYVDLLENLQNDDAAELSDDAKESRESIKSLFDGLRDFYKNVLREDVKALIDKLRDED